MPRALTAALCCCVASGCFRDARVEVGADRTVDVAVPVALGVPGGPTVDWDFADGSHASGAQVQHVFSRAGSYAVKASREGQAVATVTLQAIVRPIVHAIPESADGALYLTRVEGRLEPAIDFAERLAGPDSIQRFLDSTVLVPLALEDPNVEQQGGIGLFTLRGFRGVVGLLAARDPQALLSALEQRFARAGGASSEDPDGSARVQGPEGAQVALLADRGYLFVIVPEGTTDPHPAVLAIRGAAAGGLESSGRWMTSDLAPGSAFLFLEVTSKRETKVRTLAASLALSGGTLSVDGALRADGPLWDVGSSPHSALLDAAPQGFVAALSASVSPRDLLPVLRGLLADPSREAALARWGFSSADVERAGEALAGDLALLAYFDAKAFFTHLVESDNRPEPRGTVLFRAGVARRDLLGKLVDERLSAAELPVERDAVHGDARYRFSPQGLPAVELTLGDKQLDLRAGESLGQRPARDLGALMREGHGPEVFGPGHVSAAVDVGELVRELETPLALPDVTPQRMSMLEGFAGTFVRQLTPVDTAFIDVAPTPTGAHIRGTLALRPR